MPCVTLAAVDVRRAEQLVLELDREVGNDEAVVDVLRPLLDHRRLCFLIEYVAQRLRIADGQRQVSFEFTDGRLRRTHLAHGPVGTDELEVVARV